MAMTRFMLHQASGDAVFDLCEQHISNTIPLVVQISLNIFGMMTQMLKA